MRAPGLQRAKCGGVRRQPPSAERRLELPQTPPRDQAAVTLTGSRVAALPRPLQQSPGGPSAVEKRDAAVLLRPRPCGQPLPSLPAASGGLGVLGF